MGGAAEKTLGLAERRGFGKAKVSMQQLGVWASSKEEQKPKRGSREHSIVSRSLEKQIP
jgi:hypothetical protein